MATRGQKDPGTVNVNRQEAYNLVTNAMSALLTSEEFRAVVQAEVKAALAVETARWGGLFGEGALDPYADGYKTTEELTPLPETSL